LQEKKEKEKEKGRFHKDEHEVLLGNPKPYYVLDDIE